MSCRKSTDSGHVLLNLKLQYVFTHSDTFTSEFQHRRQIKALKHDDEKFCRSFVLFSAQLRNGNFANLQSYSVKVHGDYIFQCLQKSDSFTIKPDNLHAISRLSYSNLAFWW